MRVRGHVTTQSVLPNLDISLPNLALSFLDLQEALLLDSEVFVALLRRVCPKALKHLQKHGVGPLLYMTEWFLCLFSRTLPFPTVLRVWDAFLSEGE